MSAERRPMDWEEAKARLARMRRRIEEDDFGSSDEEILHRRAERYRRAEQVERVARMELIIFRRRESRYAAPLDQLVGIRLAEKITPLPGVSPVIQGVINMRGQIVAIHDLAYFFQRQGEPSERPWAVIGRGEAGLIALLADEIEGVQSPDIESIRPVPISLDEREGNFRGVLKEGTLVLDFSGLSRDKAFFLA